jgi:NAD(P)H dehydrogenase (quinone)
VNVLILYAHPEPTSFCGALKDAAIETIAAAGHRCVVSDLYAEGFDPVAGRHDFKSVANAARFHYQSEQAHAHAKGAFAADVTREQRRFLEADLVIVIFPLWWSGVPAIVKGWFDRVLAFGFAYVDGARFGTGFFPDKRGLVCVTTGGTPERFSDSGVYGPIGTILAPVQRYVFGYLGMTALAPFVAFAAPRVDDAARAAYLAAWRGRLAEALAA